MRKYVQFPLIIMMSFIISACSQGREEGALNADEGTSFVEAKEQGKAELTVLYVPAPGFAYRDSSGELTGVSVDIMHDFIGWFQQYHGIRVSLNFVPEEDWRVFYQRVVDAEGGVFGLGNVTITEERREELSFSPPYLDNLAVLISPEQGSQLENLDRLPDVFADLEPLAFAGTLHEVRIRQLRDQYQPQRDIARAESNQEIIDRVAAGDHYSYIDAYNYWRAKEAGSAIQRHEIADEVGETFGIIMPHSNDWETMLTAFFAAEGGYRDTDRYREVLEQHLGKALTDTLENARQRAN
ncbi:amino acid ABC transporter substrate-binding protein [Aliidiomarina minuta]|uniref:Amino acid ABC transporter substrate-binding protein n=1 Tax=Aliidiomarina minuta TaxID=880057 RepID=A0A432W6J1_9GAMM|nr:transporter substrate-binding domain-containing protein [Aliidiomarina minuta]RUO25694.1 amino acid ABC transporter substrate-binding protein [Aliidiomarina minuta]